MFDLKIINSVIDQLEEERGIPREKTLEAIESSLATAYKKEHGKRGQIIRAKFDINSGKTEFHQVKIVVDESQVKMEDDLPAQAGEEEIPTSEETKTDERVRFNPEHHILVEDAIKIKKTQRLMTSLFFHLKIREISDALQRKPQNRLLCRKYERLKKHQYWRNLDKDRVRL